MIDEILKQVFTTQMRVLTVVSLVLLVATEIGFRLGLRLHRVRDEARKGQIGGVQGAVLGLLGLLLGFTFAMSVDRYDARRALVLQEANAIGTTVLRASLLPSAHQEAVEDLLRRYVDVRLEFYEAADDRTRQVAAQQAAAAIQRELWAHAVRAGREQPTPLVATFITSLNEVVDLDAARLHAMRAHVPGAVWLLVLGVAFVGCCASGYGAGSSGVRNSFTNLALPLMIAGVITIVSDLDRPHVGLIGVSQQALTDLRDGLSSVQP